MAVKRGSILEIEISKLAFGGRGIAKVEGLTVFVGNVVPGDKIRARVFRKKKKYAEARLLEILTPSAMRKVPPCPYSGFCGGCAWQFIPYEKQLQFKREQVVESLEHIGGLAESIVLPTIPSAKQFGYRNKMEFSFSDRRWLLPDELGKEEISNDFALGLHVPGTFYKVLDIEACLLHPPMGNAILGDVRDYVKRSGIPNYGLKTHQGFWRFLMLRHSVHHDVWMVNVVTADGPRAWVAPLADYLSEKYPSVCSVVHNINTRKAAIAVGEKEALLAGDSCIRDRIGHLDFEISANSFFQTNTTGAASLYDVVKKYAQLTGEQSVMDLYSGTGTIGIYLSDSASSVTGIEISSSAVADAERNCKRNTVDNCRFICGDIADVMQGIHVTPDVMVIDPPRAGMHQRVVEAVAAMRPERIVYVSCNPTTQARDMGLLADHYRLVEVQPVDMFPHTYHIESVARLDRR
jgi:23S rRNA (uracil1939-C5)-methyltransferase